MKKWLLTRLFLIGILMRLVLWGVFGVDDIFENLFVFFIVAVSQIFMFGTFFAGELIPRNIFDSMFLFELVSLIIGLLVSFILDTLIHLIGSKLKLISSILIIFLGTGVAIFFPFVAFKLFFGDLVLFNDLYLNWLLSGIMLIFGLLLGIYIINAGYCLFKINKIKNPSK